MARFADVLYACDYPWWEKYIDIVDDCFTGEKWGLEPQSARFGVHVVPCYTDKEGLGRENVIHTGSNSGYQAINLVYLLGAKKIILIGYDMQQTNGKSHWHGDHPSSLNRHSDYKSWVYKFNSLARDLRKECIEVVNATRETALNCFDRAPLEEVLL